MNSKIHNDPDMPGHGMETLSALFDGQLHGDAARFAIKRLGHDVQWRQALGNWLVAGDALRGQVIVAAPGDFAARVAAAVSSEPAVKAAPAVGFATPAAALPAANLSRRKWFGGAALAASVAMVAMFVARPFSHDAVTTPGATTPAPTELVAAPTPAEDSPAVSPSAPDPALQLAAAAIAVAEVPSRAGERRSRGQSQRAALRASNRQLSAPAARASLATAVASNQPVQGLTASNSPANPFRPPHVEAVSRPWPRAVLPGVSATGAFTASYGTSAASSPSFYPFEPRLPVSADPAAAPVDARQPRP